MKVRTFFLIGFLFLVSLSVMAQQAPIVKGNSVRMEFDGVSYTIETGNTVGNGNTVSSGVRAFAETAATEQQDPWSTAVVKYLYCATGGGTQYADGFRLVDGWEFGITDSNDSNSFTQVRYTPQAQGKRILLKQQPAGYNGLIDGYQVAVGLPSISTGQTVFTSPDPTVKPCWVKVEILPPPAGQPMADVLLTFRLKSNGQVVGQASNKAVAASNDSWIYVRRYTSANQDPSNTGIAVINPNLGPATVTVFRRGRNGGDMGSSTFTVPAMDQMTGFADQFGTLPADYEGSWEIVSDVPVAVTGFQFSGGTFSSIPPRLKP